jgi:molybdenum cofactor guanylyltransferase
MSDLSLSAIVLAGGLSTRMGQDKALIQIEGVPLLQRTCQIALCCADRVYVVTPWVDRYRAIAVQIADPCVQFIAEIPEPGELNSQTPLKGFLQGFTQIQAQTETEWMLLLACDLPYLRADVLQNWIEESVKQVDLGTIALLPRNPEGWWEPLCGFYHRRCLPDLHNFVEAGGRSFLRWLEGLSSLEAESVRELPLSDPTVLFNCNTPDDLQNVTPASFVTQTSSLNNSIDKPG